MVKNPSAGDTGDVGFIPGSGRSSGGRNGNPFEYSCLENSTDRGVGYNPWGLKMSYMTKHMRAHVHTHTQKTFPGILKSSHLRALRPVNCTDFVEIIWI